MIVKLPWTPPYLIVHPEHHDPTWEKVNAKVVEMIEEATSSGEKTLIRNLCKRDRFDLKDLQELFEAGGQEMPNPNAVSDSLFNPARKYCKYAKHGEQCLNCLNHVYVTYVMENNTLKLREYSMEAKSNIPAQNFEHYWKFHPCSSDYMFTVRCPLRVEDLISIVMNEAEQSSFYDSDVNFNAFASKNYFKDFKGYILTKRMNDDESDNESDNKCDNCAKKFKQ